MLSIVERVITAIFTPLGVGFAIYQVVKTKKAATAARDAADKASRALKGSLVLSDLSKFSNSIEVMKGYIRSHRNEAALLRVHDVISELIHIRRATQDTHKETEIRQIITDLTIIRGRLERQVASKHQVIPESLSTGFDQTETLESP